MILLRRAELADLPAIVALLADDDLGRNREDGRQKGSFTGSAYARPLTCHRLASGLHD